MKYVVIPYNEAILAALELVMVLLPMLPSLRELESVVPARKRTVLPVGGVGTGVGEVGPGVGAGAEVGDPVPSTHT